MNIKEMIDTPVTWRMLLIVGASLYTFNWLYQRVKFHQQQQKEYNEWAKRRWLRDD